MTPHKDSSGRADAPSLPPFWLCSLGLILPPTTWGSSLLFLPHNSFGSMHCQAHSACRYLLLFIAIKLRFSSLHFCKQKIGLLHSLLMVCLKLAVSVSKANHPSVEHFFSLKVSSELARIQCNYF